MVRIGKLKILNQSACKVIGGEIDYDGFTLKAGRNIGYWTLLQTPKRDNKIRKYVARKASSRTVKQSLGLILGSKHNG